MNVLVTGGSRGIGSATCIAFAKKGYNIAINYNNSQQKAEALAEIIANTYGVKCLAIKADVSNYPQVQGMVDKAKEIFASNIDILINNAGISEQKLFTDISESDWNKMISVNLTGTFNCCKAVLKDMINNHSGTIVNISSMWGQTGASMEVHYSAAKAGVIGLTKALAKEVAPSGITVNCVAPGAVSTEMMQGFSNEDIFNLTEEIPQGRLGTPKEIAESVVFLTENSYITGQVIGVNGGLVI